MIGADLCHWACYYSSYCRTSKRSNFPFWFLFCYLERLQQARC